MSIGHKTSTSALPHLSSQAEGTIHQRIGLPFPSKKDRPLLHSPLEEVIMLDPDVPV